MRQSNTSASNTERSSKSSPMDALQTACTSRHGSASCFDCSSQGCGSSHRRCGITCCFLTMAWGNPAFTVSNDGMEVNGPDGLPIAPQNVTIRVRKTLEANLSRHFRKAGNVRAVVHDREWRPGFFRNRGPMRGEIPESFRAAVFRHKQPGTVYCLRQVQHV